MAPEPVAGPSTQTEMEGSAVPRDETPLFLAAEDGGEEEREYVSAMDFGRPVVSPSFHLKTSCRFSCFSISNMTNIQSRFCSLETDGLCLLSPFSSCNPLGLPVNDLSLSPQGRLTPLYGGIAESVKSHSRRRSRKGVKKPFVLRFIGFPKNRLLISFISDWSPRFLFARYSSSCCR